MAAVLTLVAIPTASFEFPAREWQDPMAPGSYNQIHSFFLSTLGHLLWALRQRPLGSRGRPVPAQVIATSMGLGPLNRALHWPVALG